MDVHLNRKAMSITSQETTLMFLCLLRHWGRTSDCHGDTGRPLLTADLWQTAVLINGRTVYCFYSIFPTRRWLCIINWWLYGFRRGQIMIKLWETSTSKIWIGKFIGWDTEVCFLPTFCTSLFTYSLIHSVMCDWWSIVRQKLDPNFRLGNLPAGPQEHTGRHTHRRKKPWRTCVEAGAAKENHCGVSPGLAFFHKTCPSSTLILRAHQPGCVT